LAVARPADCAREGDEAAAQWGTDACGLLYERHSPRIFSYCLYELGGRREAAEEAVQLTFLHALRALRRGVVPRVESAWLLRIARNVCLSNRRSDRRRACSETSCDPQIMQETIAEPERDREGVMGLLEAVARLPERQRRAILLREWQGLSYREIAAELGVSQAAVETLIFRARRALALEMAGQPQEERRRVHALDVGSLLGALKSVLAGGGSTIKIAAATVLLGGTMAIAVPLAERWVAASTGSSRGVPAATHRARPVPPPGGDARFSPSRTRAYPVPGAPREAEPVRPAAPGYVPAPEEPAGSAPAPQQPAGSAPAPQGPAASALPPQEPAGSAPAPQGATRSTEPVPAAPSPPLDPLAVLPDVSIESLPGALGDLPDVPSVPLDPVLELVEVSTEALPEAWAAIGGSLAEPALGETGVIPETSAPEPEPSVTLPVEPDLGSVLPPP